MTTKITTTDKRKWANQILTSNSNTKITDDFSIYWLSQEQGSKFHSDELEYTKFKSNQAIPEEERNTALVELDELLAKRENPQKIINPKIISA